MASPTPIAAFDLLDPAAFPDRDSLMAFLVNQAGWSAKKAGAIFGCSDRHARRVAQVVRETAETPDPLTPAEVRCMLRDYTYEVDPLMTSEEREAALGWMAVYAQASGVAELKEIKFRRGVRFPAKARNSFGERPRVGQA